MNRKLAQILGAASVDDTAQRILGGSLVLQPAEYAAFWRSLREDRAACARYVARMVKVLLDYEKDPSKVEKSLKKCTHSMPDYITLILHTLQYLSLFVDFDQSNEAYLAATTKFEQHRNQNAKPRDKRIFDIVRILGRQKGQAVAGIVVDCTTLESFERMPRANAFDFGPDAIDSITEVFPFSFYYLSRLTRSEFAQQIMDEILKQLSKIPAMLSSMPQFNQTRTLALLLVLREFLTQSPTADPVWLARACDILTIFFKWPRPYGIVARDMLDFISVELRAPGEGLRRRLIVENPGLHPRATMASVRSNRLRGERVVNILHDSAPLSKTYTQALPRNDSAASVETKSDEESETRFLRRKILTHIFDCDFELSKTYEEDPLFLRDHSDETISEWYLRAFEILNRAKELPVDDDGNLMPGGLCKMYREAMLADLLRTICPSKEFMPRRADLYSGDGSPTVSFADAAARNGNLMSNHHRNISTLPRTSSSHELPPPDPAVEALVQSPPPPPPGVPGPPLGFANLSAPLTPDVVYESCEFGTRPALHGQFSKTRDGYLTYPHELDHLKNLLEYTLLESVAAVDDIVLENVYTKGHKPRPTSTKVLRASYYIPVSAELPWTAHDNTKPMVRVLLMGGNSVLHHYVSAIVTLRQLHPDLYDRVEIKLFVVPVGRNDLASFVARSDLWYQRHIFATFTQPLSLCPQFPSEEEFSEGLLMEAGFGESLPVQFLRHTLQDFTRQAKQVLPVCVFDCVCWTDLGAHNLGSEEPTTTLLQHQPPDVIVPFITSAEIGLLTQARIAGGEGAKLSNLLATKDFAYAPIELSVSYVPSSMSGSIGSQDVQTIQKSDTFVTLTLTNLPESVWDPETKRRSSENAVPNAPNMRWLVLHTRPCRGAVADSLRKTKRTARDVESFFEYARDPDSFDQPSHVGLVEIAVVSPTDSFHVMLDGTVFGPFKRIRVQPCQAWGEERVVLPVMSYFPVTV